MGKLLMKRWISLFISVLVDLFIFESFLVEDDQPLEDHEYIYEHIPLRLSAIFSNEYQPMDSMSISFDALSNTYF